MKNLTKACALIVTLCFCVAGAVRCEEKSLEELTKESIAACAASASTPATVQQIIEKVRAGAALLAKEGVAAYPKFRGTNSEFLFGGTYLWVHSADTVAMLMHPIKPKLEGKVLDGLRDKDGKFFFLEMNEKVKANANGEAWVQYAWPKPGTKEKSIKVSFVKAVVVDGKNLVVGCGIYDLTIEQVNEILAK